MAKYLLGLDYGTGGAKACLIDDCGGELAYAFREYPIIQKKPGWSEHDPHLYWKLTCEITKECVLAARTNVRDIVGIAVSAALPSLVMLDGKGDVLSDAYNLMDRRAVTEVRWLKDNIGEQRIFDITANRLDDHPMIVNLLWEKQNRPEIFNRIGKALTIEGYINYRLTGKYSLVHSNAAFHGVAYNVVEKRFEENILEKIDIDQKIFPDLYYCEDVIGTVTKQAAEETGLKEGIPVAAGQADFNASCVSIGIIADGDCQMNLGTCGVLGVVHKDTNFMQEMIALGFTVDPRDAYMAIGATQTGGMSIRYLRDTISQYEIETERLLGISAYDLLTLQASTVPAGSEGLIVLPYLTGEKTPIWDPIARGCIFGLSLSHTKGHLIRAMMEGVAYALFDSFRLFMERHVKMNIPIVMNEGGARSKLWREIITDVFNVPTVMASRKSGAPFGDAVLAGVSMGIFQDYSMCKEWANYVEPMEPSAERHKIYMEYFSLFKDLYSHVKEDYVKLARLTNRL